MGHFAALRQGLFLLLLAAASWTPGAAGAQEAGRGALERIEAELRPAEPPLQPLPRWTAPGRPRLALALSGGGARGFAHVGVLAALEEDGIEVDGLTGTSAGAVAGAFVAAGYSPEELQELFEMGDWNELFLGLDVRRRSLSRAEDLARSSTQVRLKRRREPASRRPPGLLGRNGLDRALQGAFLLAQAASGGDFDRLAIPFRPVATDLVSGRKVAPSSGPLAALVRGSAGIPGLMAPVALGEALLIDGGLRENVPVETALGLSPDLVVAVDVSQGLDRTAEFGSPVDVIDRSLDIVMDGTTQRSLDLASFVLRPAVDETSRTAAANRIGPLVAAGRLVAEEQRSALWQVLEAEAPDQQRLPVATVEVTGTELVAAAVLRERLGLERSSSVARWRVASELARLLNRMPFEAGHAELSDSASGPILRFVLKERSASTGLLVDGLDGDPPELMEASLLGVRRAAWTLRRRLIEDGDVLTHVSAFEWKDGAAFLSWSRPRVTEIGTEAPADPKLGWTKRRVSNLTGQRFDNRRLSWRLDDLQTQGVVRSWYLRPDLEENGELSLVAELEPDRPDELAVGASFRGDLHWAGVLRLKRGNLSGRGDEVSFTTIAAEELTRFAIRYGNPGGLGLRTVGFELGAGWQSGHAPLTDADQDYVDEHTDEYEARGAWASLVHRARLGSKLNLGVLYEHRRLPPPAGGPGELHERTAAVLRWSLDRQDRLLFPTSGGRLSVRTDLSFAGDELWRLETKGGWAIALSRSGHTVLAPRAAFGVSDDAEHRSFWFDPGGHRGLYGFIPYGAAAPQYAHAGLVLRQRLLSKGPVDFYAEAGTDVLWTSFEGSGLDELEHAHGFGLSLTANIHWLGPITVGWSENSDDADVWFVTAGFPFLDD
jgi:predicted acylesterase/phospholipase RssA